MGQINARGMADFEAQQKRRKNAFNRLIAQPFDLHNKAQTNALNKYMDEFELYTNQMYMYQAIGMGVSTWLTASVAAKFLPLPEAVSSFFAYSLYIGAAALTLKAFSMSDYNLHRKEMMSLYNWCLKNNQEVYKPEMDNTEQLQSPMIQRLIKLLAPVCTADFDMVVWKKEVAKKEAPKGTITLVANAAQSFVSSAYSLFSQKTTPKPSPLEQDRLKQLKIDVETEALQVGTFQGIKQAIEYFCTSTEFRALFAEKIKYPKPILNEVIPSIVMDRFAPKLA